MTDANRNLLVRIVSSVVLLPAVLALLWISPWTTAGMLAVAAAILAYEFYSISLKQRDAGQWLGMLAAALPSVAVAVWPQQAGQIIAVESIALLMALFTYYLVAGPLPEAPQRVGVVFTGFFYSGVLLAALSGLRVQPDGLYWIFLVLLVTWGNDTGAYAAGRTLGKHKLYPAVSPAKTWEGFIGGLLCSVGFAMIAKATFLPQLSWLDAVLIGLPAGILGPVGDLSESMLKRAYGVKDSGKLIPGHGGLLDRVDALLFTGPYVFLYAVLAHG